MCRRETTPVLGLRLELLSFFGSDGWYTVVPVTLVTSVAISIIVELARRGVVKNGALVLGSYGASLGLGLLLILLGARNVIDSVDVQIVGVGILLGATYTIVASVMRIVLPRFLYCALGACTIAFGWWNVQGSRNSHALCSGFASCFGSGVLIVLSWLALLLGLVLAIVFAVTGVRPRTRSRGGQGERDIGSAS